MNWPGQTLALGALALSFFLSPACSMAVEVKTRPNPKIAWFEEPVRQISELPGYASLTASPGLDEYGGWPQLKFDSTGYFHTHREGNRWWLVDPAGNAFISVGVAVVELGGMPTSTTALASKFGTPEGWATATTDLLRELGFNSTGAWSNTKVLEAVPHPLVYTCILKLCARFKESKLADVGGPHVLNYDSKWFPVFNPDFPAFCEQAVKDQVYPDDPHLLGYFSDNELPLPRLENYLHLDPKDPLQAPNLQAANDWVASHHLNIDKLSKEDEEAWIGHVMELYSQITATAIRHADPHHLLLGERFFGESTASPASWKAETKYCDVISINYYSGWAPKTKDYAAWFAESGMPFMVTEFYTKGDDAGFANTSGAGWIVPTQTDRGLFYQNFVLSLLQSKNCVGWHWFKYMDNDPANLKTDPSNRDSNKGIVSTSYVPYAPLVGKMRETNLNVYPLTQYFDAQK